MPVRTATKQWGKHLPPEADFLQKNRGPQLHELAGKDFFRDKCTAFAVVSSSKSCSTILHCISHPFQQTLGDFSSRFLVYCPILPETKCTLRTKGL